MKPDSLLPPELPEHGPTPPWALRVRNLLEADASSLDAATCSRLNQARQAALGAAGRGALAQWFSANLGVRRLWLPAGLSAALVLALALVLQPGAGRHTAATQAGSEPQDLELLQGGESLELYEDQDFYAWLDTSASSPG